MRTWKPDLIRWGVFGLCVTFAAISVSEGDEFFTALFVLGAAVMWFVKPRNS